MQTKNWIRLLLLVLIGAGVIAGLAYHANRGADPGAAAPTSPPAADPTAVAQTSARASGGDVSAQLQMGIWCLEGQGQKRDERRAAEWLRQAAEKGNAEAQYRLATLYQAGRGTDRDPAKALSWFNKAAAQRHVAAIYNLGSMYEAGQGVAPDSQAAALFFRRAAELGDAYAQYNLARRYEEGHGVPRNLAEAWKWYQLANAGGVPDTLHARRSIEARLTAEQLRQARHAMEQFRRQSRAAGPR